MEKFKVSQYNDFSEPQGCVREIDAFDAEAAAETFVERYLADLDYPEETDVFVQSPVGATTKWTVFVESVPQCRARPAKEL